MRGAEQLWCVNSAEFDESRRIQALKDKHRAALKPNTSQSRSPIILILPSQTEHPVCRPNTIHKPPRTIPIVQHTPETLSIRIRLQNWGSSVLCTSFSSLALLLLLKLTRIRTRVKSRCEPQRPPQITHDDRITGLGSQRGLQLVRCTNRKTPPGQFDTQHH